MNNGNGQLELFKELGLTEREAKVYVTLLSRKSFTATELQEASDVPRTKIYEIVKRMINRGICAEKKLGNKKVFEAIEPKIALEIILDDQRREIEAKNKLKNQLVDMFTPIYNEGRKKEDIFDSIEIMKNKNQIHKKYLELVDKADKEFLYFSKGPYATDTYLKGEKQILNAFLKRGGVSKGLYVADELNEEPDFSTLLQKGQQGRITDHLPIKMLIFDEKVVMFTLDEPFDDSDLTMLAIEHKSLAATFKMLFNHLWINAKKT